MSRRRLLSSTVSAVVESERLERYLRRNRNYLCIHCSKATIKEVALKPEDLRITDEGIHRVIAYRISCENRPKKLLYDRAPHCFIGDEKSVQSGSCATCKYAKPVVVQERPQQVNQYKVDYRCYRTVYLCTNQKRMEHFSKGTYMCSYIRCSEFEETER